MDEELEDFKTHINLTEYAAAQGYVIDRKASSRNSAVMRSAAGDKIVIALGEDRHWIYFSVRDDGDNGSIIDFVQKRRAASSAGCARSCGPGLGGVRHFTRARIPTSSPARSRPSPGTAPGSCWSSPA